MLAGDAISPLGALLSVAEVTAGIASTGNYPLTRAAFALRLVHGEYATVYGDLVFNWARKAGETVPDVEGNDTSTEHLHRINESLAQAQSCLESLPTTQLPASSLELVQMTAKRLVRLRQCWNTMGIWGIDRCDLSPRDHFEMQLAEHELQRQLHSLRRECLLRAQRLEVDQQILLKPLWEGMELLT